MVRIPHYVLKEFKRQLMTLPRALRCTGCGAVISRRNLTALDSDPKCWECTHRELEAANRWLFADFKHL
jgi:hypothetical protein